MSREIKVDSLWVDGYIVSTCYEWLENRAKITASSSKLTLGGSYHGFADEYRLPNSSFGQALGWTRPARLADLMILEMLM